MTEPALSNSATAIHDLVRRRNKAKLQESSWKLEAKKADAELAEIIQPETHLLKANKLKTGGATTIIEQGAKFTMEAEKEVKWDSAKLQAIAARMPWPMVEQIFKIKFEITETSYKNCQANATIGALDPQVLALITEARQVIIKDPKITKAEIIEG